MDTKIVLIVGPSGAGKDTLINEAKKQFSNKINFVKRYITRETDVNESNFYIDEYAYEILRHNSYFASSWSAHGNFYGIPKRFIKNGLNLITISRTRIKDFENLYENVYTINVTLEKDILKQRLINRARESLDEIENRLNREYKEIVCKNLIEFNNNTTLDESKKRFFELLKRIENE